LLSRGIELHEARQYRPALAWQCHRDDEDPSHGKSGRSLQKAVPRVSEKFGRSEPHRSGIRENSRLPLRLTGILTNSATKSRVALMNRFARLGTDSIERFIVKSAAVPEDR
jgi:hypothetical protein